VRGVARDLAAAGIGTLKPFRPRKIMPSIDGGPRWRIDFPEACPWILGAPSAACGTRPSPKWLQDRLTSIGLRPINALVDVTNFFTIDLGRPLHVFDVAQTARRRADAAAWRRRNDARAERQGLHGRPRGLRDLRRAGVQSIAGVIGGEATGCDETTHTVFVECALFDPVRIALTGRRHQIVSDARQRFERGIDPALMPDAIEAATR
jgi:phenylalanyl-tRNA synthetase beta chain